MRHRSHFDGTGGRGRVGGGPGQGGKLAAGMISVFDVGNCREESCRVIADKSVKS